MESTANVNPLENRNVTNELKALIASFPKPVFNLVKPLADEYESRNKLHALWDELWIIHHVLRLGFLDFYPLPSMTLPPKGTITGASTKRTIRSGPKKGAIGKGSKKDTTVREIVKNTVSHAFIAGVIKTMNLYKFAIIKHIVEIITEKSKRIAKFAVDHSCSYPRCNCISNVNYIVPSLKHNHRQIAQTYAKQSQTYKNGALHRLEDKNNKNEIAREAQVLRDNQQSWCCYFCGQIDNSPDTDVCCCCQRGLNPLYFSKKNQSQCFFVDPHKFGIFRTFEDKIETKKVE